MKKNINIIGMSCGHCRVSVIKALTELLGGEIFVNLKTGIANVDVKNDFSDDEIKKCIEDLGFEVASIRDI